MFRFIVLIPVFLFLLGCSIATTMETFYTKKEMENWKEQHPKIKIVKEYNNNGVLVLEVKK